MKAVKRGTLVLALVLLLPVLALAQPAPKPLGAESPTHLMVTPDKVTFQPIEVPGFDTGMKIAPIHGDPSAESGAYVLRLWFPAGYQFPPHWHPMAEHVTVLEGELLLGMGDKTDPAKLMAYQPGSFLFIPGKMSHFGGAKGPTVIQLHGQAPFKIEITK
jgi:Cupin domain